MLKPSGLDRATVRARFNAHPTAQERADFLFASRPVARHLLESAIVHATPFGNIRVIGLEGLIAFKLQGLVNDPRRTQDLEDIRALIRANRSSLDLPTLREYFQLFDRKSLLDDILRAIR